MFKTKKQLNIILREIIKKNGKLSIDDSKIIYKILHSSEKYSFIDESYFFYISNYKLPNNRPVKMIFASNGQKKIPLPKNKLISEVFPSKRKESHSSRVKKAARNIIYPQIKTYRDRVELPIICPLSHNTLYSWRDIHIDHVVPFIYLFNSWLEELNMPIDDVELIGPPSNKVFKNKRLTESWYNYHLLHANLQCVDSRFNLLKSDSIIL